MAVVWRVFGWIPGESGKVADFAHRGGTEGGENEKRESEKREMKGIGRGGGFWNAEGDGGMGRKTEGRGEMRARMRGGGRRFGEEGRGGGEEVWSDEEGIEA